MEDEPDPPRRSPVRGIFRRDLVAAIDVAGFPEVHHVARCGLRGVGWWPGGDSVVGTYFVFQSINANAARRMRPKLVSIPLSLFYDVARSVFLRSSATNPPCRNATYVHPRGFARGSARKDSDTTAAARPRARSFLLSMPRLMCRTRRTLLTPSCWRCGTTCPRVGEGLFCCVFVGRSRDCLPLPSRVRLGLILGRDCWSRSMPPRCVRLVRLLLQSQQERGK